MAVSHVCVQCGKDLARVRPQRDPHYNLRLVICPRCRNACVRQMHPLRQRWRNFLRLSTSLCAMSSHLVVLIVLLAFNLRAVAQLADIVIEDSFARLLQEGQYFTIGYLIMTPLILGTWLALGMGHIRPWKVWLGWTIMVAMLLLLDSLTEEFYWSQFSSYWWANEAMFMWITRVGVLAVFMVVAAAGIPVGRALQRAAGRHRRHHWRKRRARLRKLRTAA